MKNSNYSLEDINNIAEYALKVQKALESDDFKEFLSKKSQQILERLTRESLNEDTEEKYLHNYRKNHKVEVSNEYITISNTTDIPVENINQNIARNYPNGFDLAKAVEYGTGIVGAISDAYKYAIQDGWQYMVNANRDYGKGWFYEQDGKVYWTEGMSGKLIFNKAVLEIEEKLYEWIDEYLDKIE